MLSIQNEFNLLQVEAGSGQVVRWLHKNDDIFYTGNSLKRTGIPILFPFANPLNNNIFDYTGKEIAQHGFGRNCFWKTKSNNDKIILTLTKKDLNLEMQQAYPFNFVCQIELILERQKLRYKLKIKNKDSKILPIAPGIHPYFKITHSDKKDLQISNLKKFDATKINWDDFKKEIFYEFLDDVLIIFPNHKMIEISQPTINKEFKHLVIWSSNPTEKDYNFVCVEPFTRETNGINKNPILVKPNQTWQAEIIFTVF